MKSNIHITGSGNFIPEHVVPNNHFKDLLFLKEDGKVYPEKNQEIIAKFAAITGIHERRYADDGHTASDIGAIAGKRALENAQCDPETIDHIIVAHNFGDVKHGTVQSDILPSLASRIKQKLGIQNPSCVAYDLLFGCPGWLEGMIQAVAFMRAGMARKCLVIGTETLSRVLDPHDRDSMIFSDGAGATLLEVTDKHGGVLSHESASFTLEEADYLYFGPSNDLSKDRKMRYIKMQGRKIYEFCLQHVPIAMKQCFDASGKEIRQLKKILIHQANEKMDEAIVKRFYRMYRHTPPEGIMPMSIGYLGNSSVATIPTLYDLIRRENLKGHHLEEGDVLLFASVGAGMHINALTYQV